MTNESDQNKPELTRTEYAEGKREGLAIGAIAAGAVAFISLLGVEKAILAIVLAVLAFRGAKAGSAARRLSLAAIVVAAVYALTYIILLVLYYDKLVELIHLLQKLG